MRNQTPLKNLSFHLRLAYYHDSERLMSAEVEHRRLLAGSPETQQDHRRRIHVGEQDSDALRRGAGSRRSHVGPPLSREQVGSNEKLPIAEFLL